MESQPGSKKEFISYLDNISLFLLGILFIGFPIFITSITTDPFGLPKQAFLGVVVLVVLILQGVKMVLEKTIRIRRTPFDLAIIGFTAITFISSLLAVNRTDAVIAFIPLFFGILLYFVVINTARDRNSVLFLQTALIGGAVIASILAVLSLLGIYVLPFDFAKSALFSPIGSLLDQALYLALVLPIAGYPLLKPNRNHEDLKDIKGGKITLGVATGAIAVGLGITIFNLIAKQNPILLPFETGFQTAFAAISQDAGRIAQGFFFGSGFGTYGADFTRFKQPGFNLNPTLWSITFFRSSSFVLELLATSGLLGLLSFVYLAYKVIKERPVFIPLILAIVGLFLLPFSFVNQVLFFILLASYSAAQGIKRSSKYYDVELQLVAFKKGLIAFEEAPARGAGERSGILSILTLIVILAMAGYIGYSGVRYITANVYFQRSLVAAAQNNGTLTYQNQVKALSAFGQVDAYQRIFSQTNLALANSLAAQLPKDSTPSAETTQTIYTLIQQSINAGREASTIAPQTSLNWQNLSNIYRSLIGFGQNADQFAVLTAQQAVALDPNNPQGYITLGGIFYQLGAWDQAIQQFQTAITLKPDLSNGYYNLGHALEQKGDLKGALQQYQNVKSLVGNDKANLDKINQEIDTLQKRISGQASAGGQTTPSDQLEVSTPSAQLPPQNPPVKIPAPEAKAKVTPVPTKAAEKPAPTQTEEAPQP